MSLERRERDSRRANLFQTGSWISYRAGLPSHHVDSLSRWWSDCFSLLPRPQGRRRCILPRPSGGGQCSRSFCLLDPWLLEGDVTATRSSFIFSAAALSLHHDNGGAGRLFQNILCLCCKSRASVPLPSIPSRRYGLLLLLLSKFGVAFASSSPSPSPNLHSRVSEFASIPFPTTTPQS